MQNLDAIETKHREDPDVQALVARVRALEAAVAHAALSVGSALECATRWSNIHYMETTADDGCPDLDLNDRWIWEAGARHAPSWILPNLASAHAKLKAVAE